MGTYNSRTFSVMGTNWEQITVEPLVFEEQITVELLVFWDQITVES